MALQQYWLQLTTALDSQHLLPSSLLLPISLVLLALILVARPKRSVRKLNLPPGPRPLPLLGNLHQLGSMPNLSLHKLANKYGPILHLTLGQIPTVVLSSSRLTREVLRTHDLQVASRPRLYTAEQLLYGCTDIAFAPYGAYWRNVRKICIMELLSARRVESYAADRQAEVARLVQRVGKSAHPGTVNLSQALSMYANGVVCRAAFGKDFDNGEQHGFHQLLYDLQVLLGGFLLGDFYPSLQWINVLTGSERVLQRTRRGFDRLLDELIREHLEKRKKRGQEELANKDLVDVLLDVQQNSSVDQEWSLTTDNIKAIILDMFFAATDTSSITLDWALIELILNPKKMEKAQAEVRNVIGERKTVYESDLHRMYYLKAIVKEILRLHPPAPLLPPREATEDIVIDGYDIPTKTRIFINAWAIGREPESWENPDTFQPERFLENAIDYRGQDFSFIPFGSGRRMCPGISFAMVDIEIALAQLLHSFDWELPPGTKASDLDMTEVFGITSHRKEDLVLVAKHRKYA